MAIVVLGAFHAQILTGVAAFMSVPDRLEPADVLLVLYHEGHTVPFAAAGLYRRRYASQLVLGRMQATRLEALGLLQPRHEVWRKVFEAEGVPPEAIALIGHRLEDDVDLGRALAVHLAQRAKTRVIVVASAQASRLSRDDLRRGLAGAPVELRMYPVALREFDEHTWWKHRRGWLTYFDAYYLWFVRLLRH